MTSDIFRLIRKYPHYATTLIVIAYTLAFGFVALMHGVIALALALGFLYVMADEDKDDDDWTEPFSPV